MLFTIKIYTSLGSAFPLSSPSITLICLRGAIPNDVFIFTILMDFDFYASDIYINLN